MNRIDAVAQKIMNADRGYSGLFDTIKVEEDQLARVYEFDLSLAEGVNEVATKVDGYYRLKELRRETEKSWQEMDVLVTPTAGTIYTIAQVEADSIVLNSNLGYYTNYVNLLDLSALAVPAGFTPDDLPFGVTLVARKFKESFLSAVGAALHRRAGVPMGATNHAVPHSEGATLHA